MGDCMNVHDKVDKHNGEGKVPQGVCSNVLDALLCGLFCIDPSLFVSSCQVLVYRLFLIEVFVNQHGYKWDNDNVAEHCIAN